MKREKKQKIDNTILNIIPIRYYDSKYDCYILEDETFMDILKIVSKDLINSGDDAVELDCLKYAKFYKLYDDELKLITSNFPTNTAKQQAYLVKKLEKTSNEKQKKWLRISLKEMEYLDKNTTKREYYLMTFSDNAEKHIENIRKIKNYLLTGRDGLIEVLPKIKKHQILFKINNKNSAITSENRLFEEEEKTDA